MLLWAKNNKVIDKKMLDLTSAPVRFWGMLIIMFGYAMLLELLVFYFASAIFLPVSMSLLGARKKLLIAFTTSAVLLFVYCVFELLLSVPLPESMLL